MAWESGFFNSVNGDRLYNADKFNEIFEGLITNGVFKNVDKQLVVQPNNGMTIQVNTGRGWFNNHWVRNTSEKLIVLDPADVVLNRYAAIIVKVDETTPVRDVTVEAKYSDFASNPVKPSMTRTSTINEYCLAYVYIKAKATAISAGDIEDTRFNSNLCGWVTGIIDQVDTDTLYAQWESLFNDWFEGLQDFIDENTETKLVNALPVSVSLTLSSDGWSSEGSSYHEQSITVPNMNDTKSVIVEIGNNTNDIVCVEQSTNTLKFTASSLPAEDITVKVVCMGV